MNKNTNSAKVQTIIARVTMGWRRFSGSGSTAMETIQELFSAANQDVWPTLNRTVVSYLIFVTLT